MPLNTQIVHNGEELSLRWGGWHLDCMLTVALYEQSPEWVDKLWDEHDYADIRKKGFGAMTGEWDVPIEFFPYFHYYVNWPTDLLSKGVHIVKGEWKFYDPSDGEILELWSMDKLVMYRG